MSTLSSHPADTLIQCRDQSIQTHRWSRVGGQWVEEDCGGRSAVMIQVLQGQERDMTQQNNSRSDRTSGHGGQDWLRGQDPQSPMTVGSNIGPRIIKNKKLIIMIASINDFHVFSTSPFSQYTFYHIIYYTTLQTGFKSFLLKSHITFFIPWSLESNIKIYNLMALKFFFSPQCQNLCVYFVFGCLFVPINECNERISASSHIPPCFLTVNLLTQWDVILNWPELNSCELFLASWIALGVLWLPSCSSDWLWEVQKAFPHSDHLDLFASVINCLWKKQHWWKYLTLSLCPLSSLLCSANVFVLCADHVNLPLLIRAGLCSFLTLLEIKNAKSSLS